MTMTQTTTSKIIGAILIGAGIYVGYKNFRSPGFWPGVLAASLALGIFTVKIYK